MKKHNLSFIFEKFYLKQFLLVLFILIFNNTSFSQFSNNFYKDNLNKFSITFPENWIIKGSKQENTIIKAVFKSDNLITLIAIAKYENMLIPIDKIKESDLLQDFQSIYPEAKIKLVESGKTTINGVKSIWSIFRISQSNTNLYIYSYHINRGTDQFRISGTTNGDLNWFNKYKPILKKSIESFKFL